MEFSLNNTSFKYDSRCLFTNYKLSYFQGIARYLLLSNRKTEESPCQEGNAQTWSGIRIAKNTSEYEKNTLST